MKTTLLIILTLVVICAVCRGSRDCDSYTDCVSCTNHKTWNGDHCRWCPLDRECHGYASLVNTCREEENIQISSRCTDTPYGVYNPESAFSYTLLSAVAYSDEPQKCADDILPNNSYELDAYIGRRCEDLSFFKYKECFAYTAISHVKRNIVLAYRGTDTTGRKNSQLFDEIESILGKPKTPFLIGGEVQHYFKQAHDKLFACVKDSIQNLVQKYPDYDVVVTGHSLGGAIASLAAALLVYDNIVKSDKLVLYTFGQPRVGDKEYAMQHDKIVYNSWRVVHFRDIVSHLPTCNLLFGCRVTTNGPYHHGTEIYYPEKDMNVNSEFRECLGNEDDSCSNGAVSDSWCVPGIDLDKCVEYHKHYFGIAVGTICKDGKQRLRRDLNSTFSSSGTDESDMWHLFSSETCRSLDPNMFSGGLYRTNTNDNNRLKPDTTLCIFLLLVITF